MAGTEKGRLNKAFAYLNSPFARHKILNFMRFAL